MPERIEMHEVQGWDEMKNPGDYMMVDRSKSDERAASKGSRFAIIVCPKCLKPGACSDHKLVQETPLTIRASFLCGQRMPDGSRTDCQWHGYVTDGFMEAC